MMKNIKKLLSLSLASASLASMTLLTANADGVTTELGSKPYMNFMEGMEEFNDYGYYKRALGGSSYKTYYNPKKGNVVIVRYQIDRIYFVIPNDEKVEETLDLIREIPDVHISKVAKVTGDPDHLRVYLSFYVDPNPSRNPDDWVVGPKEDAAAKEKNVNTAAKVSETLIENDIEFTDWVFSHNQVMCDEYPSYVDVPAYRFDCWIDYYGIDFTPETFAEYIESLDVDYRVDFCKDDREHTVVTLTPNVETTVQERFDLMKKIYDETGFKATLDNGTKLSNLKDYPGNSSDESSSIPGENSTTYLLGDANCDTKVTIADSTAILQALGNEDKYGLSPEGKINADVDGVNGITCEDAIKIQMFSARMIDSLL